MSVSASLVVLLDVVKRGSSVRPLLRRGMEYAQIAELLEEARELRLFDDHDGVLRLTSRGKALLAANIGIVRGKPSTWIGPLNQYRITRAPLDAVYLPDDIPSKLPHQR